MAQLSVDRLLLPMGGDDAAATLKKSSVMVSVSAVELASPSWSPDQGFRPDTPPAETAVSTSLSAVEAETAVVSSVTISSSTTTTTPTTRAATSISQSDDPVVAVLGVGYVGAHLVDVFSARYPVIGFDVSERRVRELREREMRSETGPSFVRYECDPSELALATHFLISVPTLLRPDRTIDSSCLRSALGTVRDHARAGATVVIESSVAVGMTRELLGPLAAERGFFAGMSPERVDPGRTDPPMWSIPKIVSGLDTIAPGSLDAIARLYGPVFENVVPVSSPEVAEMTKLYENCQRMVGIAYANEMADACGPLGIDPFEVCAAAATKPFGYAPFSPGLGVGGHCIPVNPFYLLSNCAFPLLQHATAAMWERPRRLAQRALERLKQRMGAGAGCGGGRIGVVPRVLVVGLGFKPGQSNLSNSPGVELVKALVISQQVHVAWADALVPQEAFAQVPRLSDDEWTREGLAEFDLVIVSFRQVNMDFGLLEGLDDGTEVEMWCR